MPTRLITTLRRLAADQSGQSLVIIAIMMVALGGAAALAIDVSTWYAQHHHDQMVADAAALAGANCLANPNRGTDTATMPQCKSDTDVSDAKQVAVGYAASNNLTISSSQVTVDTSNKTVTISAHADVPSIFAGLFNINSVSTGARAAASWARTESACNTPGTGCAFMFAGNTNCSSAANGIYLTMSGTTTVSGNIQSNANLSGATSGNISLGTATYGPNGTGTCSNSISYSGNDPWSTPPAQAASDAPWPIDYTKDFPACGGTGETACSTNGSTNGYPTFCTNGARNITLTGNGNGDHPVSGNIYCASGTGSKSSPSSWNGSITIEVSATNTLYNTFVGGSIDFTGSGNDTLSSCGYTTTGYTSTNCNASVPVPVTGNYPVFYATGTSSLALDITISGNQTINGDLFAPNGTAYLSWSGTKTIVSCIEADNISAGISGTFKGDGPVGGSVSSGGSGTDALIPISP